MFPCVAVLLCYRSHVFLFHGPELCCCRHTVSRNSMRHCRRLLGACVLWFHRPELCYCCWYTFLKWCGVKQRFFGACVSVVPVVFLHTRMNAIRLRHRCVSTSPPPYYASNQSFGLDVFDVHVLLFLNYQGHISLAIFRRLVTRLCLPQYTPRRVSAPRDALNSVITTVRVFVDTAHGSPCQSCGPGRSLLGPCAGNNTNINNIAPSS
ncbi:hypothetical protein DFS33DRAFT_225028 [Desarmillaria ectypa]|nr:hypothetical protein DFS33DRAFT_225028 [Desarmillaria ectypa]